MSERKSFILVNDRVRANAIEEVRKAPWGQA